MKRDLLSFYFNLKMNIDVFNVRNLVKFYGTVVTLDDGGDDDCPPFVDFISYLFFNFLDDGGNDGWSFFDVWKQP